MKVGGGGGGVLVAFGPGKKPVVRAKQTSRAGTRSSALTQRTSFNLPRGCSSEHGPTYDHSPRSREKILRSRLRRVAEAAIRKTDDSRARGKGGGGGRQRWWGAQMASNKERTTWFEI
jgi:hypothetical protein